MRRRRSRIKWIKSMRRRSGTNWSSGIKKRRRRKSRKRSKRRKGRRIRRRRGSWPSAADEGADKPPPSLFPAAAIRFLSAFCASACDKPFSTS